MHIKANFDLCTGCRVCQLTCSIRLFGGYNPRRAVLDIIDSRENLYHKPVLCNQCENAYCMNVCPAGAVSRDVHNAVVIDPEKCIKCYLCVEYCPEGMVKIDPESEKAVKCDLCGGFPECVSACPAGALELLETGGTNG